MVALLSLVYMNTIAITVLWDPLFCSGQKFFGFPVVRLTVHPRYSLVIVVVTDDLTGTGCK